MPEPPAESQLAFSFDTPEHAAATTEAPLEDQSARDAIVRERDRNLVIVAGAGTGKTTALVKRIVDMVAPAAGRRAYRLERLAAVTFTRRAAGELRYRLREQLLHHYAKTRDRERVQRLGEAISALDTAPIGTIHSFAERLLRLRPVEARLSPDYELAEETDTLIAETVERLRRAAERDTLASELGREGVHVPPDLVAAGAATVRAYVRTGLRLDRSANLWGGFRPSLFELVEGFVQTRDAALQPPASHTFDREDFGAAVATLRKLTMPVEALGAGDGEGHRWVRRLGERLVEAHEDEADIDELCQLLSRLLDDGKKVKTKKNYFPSGGSDWELRRALIDDKLFRRPSIPPDLSQRLRAPLRCLAADLVRLRPIVLALYERVKAEHGVADQIDLLLKLRDLLAADPAVRGLFQQRFDHILIDEFQDTDPLQVEVVFYLCESGQAATRWHQVKLRPGSLTVVGDPKQSIYRFRRADITTYLSAKRHILDQGGREEHLVTNFRSRPELIEIFNQTLSKLLDGDAPADAACSVPYERLLAVPANRPRRHPAVHGIRYLMAGAAAPKEVGDGRPLEAEAIARYIRWLLAEELVITDPDSGDERRLRPSDIAILAPVTTALSLLLRELDTIGIPYTARGGRLFLGHPVVRRTLLAVRALADGDDGVAAATLLAPPFFAVEPGDLFLERLELSAAARAWSAAERSRLQRVREARSIVDELVAASATRSPGGVLRDLIENTGLGRRVACGDNGQQRLASLYQLAYELDRLALTRGHDFEKATRTLRQWAEVPIYYDAPEPLDERAVQVMTIHQAKGLEFPVVILWDAFARLAEYPRPTWLVGRDDRSWQLHLEWLKSSEPDASDLTATERVQVIGERRRLYYVAATRARELLALPLPAREAKDAAPGFGTDPRYVVDALRTGISDACEVLDLEPYRPDATPAWARQVERDAELASTPSPSVALGLEEQLAGARRTMADHVEAARRPRALPLPVTRIHRIESLHGPPPAAARAGADTAGVPARVLDDGTSGAEDDVGALRRAKHAGARFGPRFGTAVHRALEFVLDGTAPTPERAVALAAAEIGLAAQRASEAEADVGRALSALEREGWRRRALITEQPVVLHRDGRLLTGVIDLLAYDGREAAIIDYKTDASQPGPLAASYPDYATQLELYADGLRASGCVGERAVRKGILFTETGELRWV